MSWDYVKLKNICQIKSGKRLPKGTGFSDIKTEFPYIRARDIKNGIINENELVYLSEDVQKKIQKYIVNTGDIVITIVGASVGDVGYVKDSCNGFNLTENAVRLTEFDSRVNSKCLLYMLNSKKYWELMQQIAGGSAQPKLGIYKLESIPLDLPPTEIQNRIADILSSYDNLIENNQKQIKLLEEAAQRLYKEWFVDLHFPGYENVKLVDGVPEGWKNVPLRNMISFDIGGGWGEESIKEKSENPAYVIRGTDLYGITHGDMSSIPFRYHTESNLSSRILQDGDIVFEVSGGSKTEGVARTLLIRNEMLESYGSPVICASFCKLLRVTELLYSQYVYDTFQFLRSSGKTAEFDKKSASSIVNYRWKDFLAQQNILVPPRSILDTYNCLAESFYYQIINHSKQIESLKNARDRLLPKLMSGEIEV
ncbi:restriction endonuclease subunit S [Fannyhessea vaginae]|uniref:restriction endonuclease subunit S n=1 Tax=Fannyhessea vaginae TaxID=82135 RepID=UPI0026F1F893|nr:restriction endonuclease subunit S [Fannyhessea vaginae]